jgi:two-component system, OmpR family, response regulator
MPFPKVLIIDDEIDSCLLLKSYLTQLKFEVFTAFTLQDGLKMIRQVSPTILFLDNNLPDGLGWDQLGLIREQVPHCRINLISAYHYDINSVNTENVSIIEKPFSLATIRKHVS